MIDNFKFGVLPQTCQSAKLNPPSKFNYRYTVFAKF